MKAGKKAGCPIEEVTKLAAQHAEWDKSCTSREAAANESPAR